jgi:hypothetical protein
MTEEDRNWLKERLADERRRAMKAAAVFARVCRDGPADDVYNASLLLDECVDDAWRFAMAKVAKLSRVSPEIRDAFVPVWVQHKMLPLFVGHRPTMAAALRVLMPSSYSGPPLTIYRGTHTGERRRRLYGFSWTTDMATARSFAKNWSRPELGNFRGLVNPQGLVLKTLAPPEAVLLMRQPEDYYDETEVVVDPFRLRNIDVVERV